MASVLLAHDEELDRPVAIKVLAETLSGDPSFRERFVREARLVAKLSHPNVVQVYDVDAGADAGAFIVMEYVEGETLADVVARRGKLPPEEVVDVARQVCAGLQHAHERGLVHRDVKPANLLVRRDGVLKVADFGIARLAAATRLTQAGTVLGTAAYLAPEQLAGEDVTAAADLYSLGAVLYELSTGRPPYVADSLPQLALIQNETAITPVRDVAPAVPVQLEDVVMRCLARDPAHRPRSAAAVAVALGDRDAATVPLALRRPVPTTTRRKWPWAAAITAVVAAGAGIAIGIGRTHGTTKPKPPRIAPIRRGATAADEARNLDAWLRRYSR